MEADSGTGIGAYRFMLQQNLGKTMLEFQEVRMLDVKHLFCKDVCLSNFIFVWEADLEALMLCVSQLVV